MTPSLHSLPLFHRIAGSRVVVVGAGETAEAKRRLIERAGGICCDENAAAEMRLAFVALDDPAQAEAAASRLKARGLLVNVADRPDLCDFTLPSVLERGAVLMAVGTGGASAGLAKHLRLRLETLLPPSLAQLAAGLAAARGRMRARWPDPVSRRRALDEALTDGGPLDPLDERAPSRLDAWLDADSPSAPTEIVTITLASDDPDDLTLRQARLLGMADTVLHTPDIPPAILSRARADAVLRPDGQAAPCGRLTVKLTRTGCGGDPEP